MSLKAKNMLLWMSVVPGAILGGFLLTFPLHWILYGTLVSGSVISGVDIEPIERFLSPFVIALGFVLTGSRIAPIYKFKTAVVLTAIYVLLFLSIFIFISEMVNFESRGLGALTGAFLGLFIARKKYKSD